MLGQNPAKRSAAAAILFLHLLVLAVAPFVHAQGGTAARDQAVHVTADLDGCCTPPHNDLTCDICRALRAPARAPAVGGAVPTPAVTPQPLAPRTAAVPLRSSWPLTLHSRAPPRTHA